MCFVLEEGLWCNSNSCRVFLQGLPARSSCKVAAGCLVLAVSFSCALYVDIPFLLLVTRRYCRENLEGEYSGLEHEVVDGVVESLKVRKAKSCSRLTAAGVTAVSVATLVINDHHSRWGPVSTVAGRIHSLAGMDQSTTIHVRLQFMLGSSQQVTTAVVPAGHN